MINPAIFESLLFMHGLSDSFSAIFSVLHIPLHIAKIDLLYEILFRCLFIAEENSIEKELLFILFLCVKQILLVFHV